jgi:hypothetical protein
VHRSAVYLFLRQCARFYSSTRLFTGMFISYGMPNHRWRPIPKIVTNLARLWASKLKARLYNTKEHSWSSVDCDLISSVMDPYHPLEPFFDVLHHSLAIWGHIDSTNTKILCQSECLSASKGLKRGRIGDTMDDNGRSTQVVSIVISAKGNNRSLVLVPRHRCVLSQ